VQVAARGAPQQQHELGLRQRRDLADRRDPACVELARSHRPDAPQALDGKRMEKRQLAVGRHDEQPVGLGHPARDLGEELRPCDANRDRDPDLREHVLPQPLRDPARRPPDTLHAAHVEERLVDRHALDDGVVSSKTRYIALLASL
jgi:hypothetical protein